MRINPCHSCPLSKGCEAKAAIMQKVSGIGAVSVSFECDVLRKALRVGRRIRIEAPIFRARYLYEDDCSYERTYLQVAATITSVSGYYRFASVIDAGQITEEDVVDGTDHNKIRFRKAMRHTRIKEFLNEPDAVVCESGNPVSKDGCDNREECWCSKRDGPLKEAQMNAEIDSWF